MHFCIVYICVYPFYIPTLVKPPMPTGWEGIPRNALLLHRVSLQTIWFDGLNSPWGFILQSDKFFFRGQAKLLKCFDIR